MIGNKRHRITIQRLTIAYDPATNQVLQSDDNWTDISTRWASVRPLSARELQYAQQTQSQISHEIRIRYDSSLALTTADRIKFGSRIFNIDSVINDKEMNVEFIIKVIEEV